MVVLAVLLTVGAGTIGGVFFAFSAFIMQALADLHDRQLGAQEFFQSLHAGLPKRSAQD